MKIKPEHEQRLKDVLEDADEAFWAVITKNFPETQTGDWPPDLAFARNYHNNEDVMWWLQFNAPELLYGE